MKVKNMKSQEIVRSMLTRMLLLFSFCMLTLCLMTFSLILSEVSAKNTESLEHQMKELGMVDVQALDSTLHVLLKYSTQDNFMSADVYGDLSQCYLEKTTAKKLLAAQKVLKKAKPGFSLLIYDGGRPVFVQKKMWQRVKGTKMQNYVANPKTYSIHNFGAAVDLTIIDSKGIPLDMGTPFDYLGELSQPRYEKKFLAQGKLTKAQVTNRLLLRNIMTKAGFKSIPNEWWHFNACSLHYASKNLKLLP